MTHHTSHAFVPKHSWCAITKLKALKAKLEEHVQRQNEPHVKSYIADGWQNNTKCTSYMYVYTCTCPCCFFLAHCPCTLANSASGNADNVWWSTGEHTPHSWRHHPHPDAPRCIPCHYDDSSYKASPEATIPSYKAIKGCPCTPKLLCAHNNHSDHMSEDWFNKYCDMPRLPYHMYSMHGGAGALMSIGLMRKVGWDFVEPCVLKTFSTGTRSLLPLVSA